MIDVALDRFPIQQLADYCIRKHTMFDLFAAKAMKQLWGLAAEKFTDRKLLRVN